MKKALLIISILLTSLFAQIDLNTATISELTKIKGIGPKKAKAIIEYRKKHKFNSVNDLLKIKGIGPKLLNKIKNEVSVKKLSKIKTPKKK